MKSCACGADIPMNRRVCRACKDVTDARFLARRTAARISSKVRREVLTRDGMICRHCGRAVRRSTRVKDKAPDVLTFDHFPIPVSKGGMGTADNVVVCCFGCNVTRGNSEAPKA